MALKNLESGTQVIWTTMKILLCYLEFDSHWLIRITFRYSPSVKESHGFRVT